MRLLSADEARGLLEKGSWTIVECSKREDLRTPPKTGHIVYVGSGEQGALVIGCILDSSERTMTFARSFWSPQQLNDVTILLYRTSVNRAKYDIPSRDADYYVVTRTR